MLAELARQADDARRGHPRLVARLLGALRASRRESDDPQLDPARSRGGIHELELAIDVMDAIFNDKDEVHPVNVPNVGGALPGFPDDLVVEVLGRCGAARHRAAAVRAAAPPRPRARRELGEYQALAADAAWSGTRRDAIRALCANPLVQQLPLAERALRGRSPRRTAATCPSGSRPEAGSGRPPPRGAVLDRA